MPATTVRLFVAIWLPAAIRDHLDGVLKATPDPPTAGEQVRRTREDTWHLTLAFLGEVAEGPALARFAALGQVSQQPPGPMQLAGSGTFGAITWIGVRHGPWLGELASRVQREMRVTDRRFQAHITVARVRRGPNPERPIARELACRLAGYEGPQWTPEAIVLVQSQLGPHPHYPIRARIPFAGTVV